MLPTAAIVVPTRDRPGYLEVALASIAPQARAAGADLIVVDDGADEASRAVAARHGATYLAHERPRGPNAARNTGIDAARGELIVLVDDDVRVPDGWLGALLAGVAANPAHEAFGGPIRASLEGSRLRLCGREGPPITFLDLGRADSDAELVWSANMAVRRAALERVGAFDPALEIYGDEEEWQRRLHEAGGRVRYLAAAGLEHRRAGRDARLVALARAAWRKGRNSRRFDARKGVEPTLAREIRVLAGCAWHLVRRRCATGIIAGAEAAGRLRETLAPGAASGPAAVGPGGTASAPAGARPGGTLSADAPGPAPPSAPDILSGSSGAHTGRRSLLEDLACDALLRARGAPVRLARAAVLAPPARRVLALAIDSGRGEETLARARAELERTRHDLELAVGHAGVRGKFENLNALLGERALDELDWLLVLDDDVELPAGFLDCMLALAEHYSFDLAQPAHRRRSHAAWEVTRRRPGTLARQTAFVEIGPVTLFARSTFDALLPFPPLRYGWGLDLHWAAIARARGWRLGVIDALPVGHSTHAVAAAYDPSDAIAEARAFLTGRPHVTATEAQRTLARRLRW